LMPDWVRLRLAAWGYRTALGYRCQPLHTAAADA
jgi:hypothetical protein